MALRDVANGSQFEHTAIAPAANEARHEQPTDLPALQRIQVWDLPIRVFHWSLLAAVSTAIVTGKLGGSWMEVHGQAGLAIVGLVAFRLSWGLLGSTHARFVNFLPTPTRVKHYLQGRWHGVGHNPLGALSVVALLGILGIQATTGLVSNDDIAFTGPLANWVDEALSQQGTAWHHQLANVLFVLLGLHVAAIAFYAWVKKDRLVKPMITGWKEVKAPVERPKRGKPIALAVSVAMGVGAIWLASGSWIPQQTHTPAPSTGSSTGSSTSSPGW